MQSIKPLAEVCSMSERDILFAVLLVASIAILALIAAVYFAWRTREKCAFAFNTAFPEHPANRTLSYEHKKRR
jgi:hypothetical protein